MRHLFTAAFLAGAMLHAQEPSAPIALHTETASIKSMQPSPPANVLDTSTPVMPPTPAAPLIAIEIDLSAQRAWILQEGQRVYETPISSGRDGFETPQGNFTITEKDPDHKSSLYGKIVGADGRVLVSDADSDMPLPAGAKFQQAPMKNFLRFSGAVGMHAGRLPGYPASHGCVRLPPSKAALFFNIVEIGTPVRVFGKAPRTGPTAKKPTVVNVAAAAATPSPVEAKRRGMFWFLKR